MYSYTTTVLERARVLLVALPRVLSQSTGCSHSCCDALDERRSSYGRSSIDGAYEDCATLALLGHCRTAGHFCDRSCGRCANAREDAEPAWGDVGGWAAGRGMSMAEAVELLSRAWDAREGKGPAPDDEGPCTR